MRGWAERIRHLPIIERIGWLWRVVQPAYAAYLRLRFGRRGVATIVNGEPLRVVPACRAVGAWDGTRGFRVYELAFWKAVMPEIRPSDVVADVGAHVGIYTVGFARRARSGRVYAFEPDPENAAHLRAHVTLNAVAHRVEVIEAAVGDVDGSVPFAVGDHRLSAAEDLYESASARMTTVPMVSLDSVLAGGVDVLKIDVEGFEGRVLDGARSLLGDSARRPHLILLELHTGVLGKTGWSEEAILSLLRASGYDVEELWRAALGVWSRAVVVARVPPG